MTGRTFLDTNVVVYLFDAAEPAKQACARDLLRREEAETFVVSTQVLSEFYVTVTRKLHRPLDRVAAREAVRHLGRFTVVSVDVTMIHAAIDTAEQAQISYWDALIVEAAESAHCPRLLTEDLSAGQTFRSVRIENPFTAAGTA